MTAPPPPLPPAPERPSLLGLAARVGDQLVTTLPPAFLLLILINVAFLGLTMWFLEGEIGAKSALIDKIIDRCTDIALHAPPPSR